MSDIDSLGSLVLLFLFPESFLTFLCFFFWGGGGASSFIEYSLTDITSNCLHVLGSLVEMFLGNAKLT